MPGFRWIGRLCGLLKQRGLVPPDVLAEVGRVSAALLFVFLVGALPLWLYAAFVCTNGRWWAPVGISFSIAAVAGCVGFLFAFPSVVAASAPAASAPAAAAAGGAAVATPAKPVRRYAAPTHLDAITDWLTKAITGVGLVTFQSTIWPRLVKASDRICESFGPDTHVPPGVGWAYLLFFLAVGFLFGFLPARFYVPYTLNVLDALGDAFDQGKAAAASAFDQLAASAGARPVTVTEFRKTLAKIPDPGSVVWNSDPHKGKFGGKPQRGDWELSARIEPVFGAGSAVCKVAVTVRSRAATAPTGNVVLHLHPTFPEPVVDLPLTNGQAQYEITSGGAFTIGVDAPGDVKLELDLMDVLGGTEEFYRS